MEMANALQGAFIIRGMRTELDPKKRVDVRVPTKYDRDTSDLKHLPNLYHRGHA